MLNSLLTCCIVKVAVVATVSQQMGDDGQLVVRIESIEVDQKILDSIETPCRQENAIEVSSFKDTISNSCEPTTELGEQNFFYLMPIHTHTYLRNLIWVLMDLQYLQRMTKFILCVLYRMEVLK